MSGQTWSMVFGIAGVVIGVAGLVIAMVANRRANAANMISQQANEIAGAAKRLSGRANEIAEQALESSERIGREQVELQRREVELAHKAEEDRRRAHIQVFPGQRSSRGEFRLKVENRGPHHADRVRLSITDGDRTVTVGQPSDLAPAKALEFVGHRGSVFAGAVEMESDDLSRSDAQAVELRVEFTDGNGPQSLRKRLIIGPGSRFVDRRWTIEDWGTDE